MGKKSELVRINKEMNLNKVDIEEGFQNLYVNIIQTINCMEQYEHIRVSKSDLIKLLGANSRNTEYLHNIFLRLTGSNEIKIGDKKIYGSIFSAKIEKDGSYLIAVNEFYKEFLFTKTDIDLMYKVKKYKNLPMSPSEVEYWNKTLKEKKKFMMILNNASIKALRGKNNKTIYSMLKEFSGSTVAEGEHEGECYKKISYKDFKEALQLSENYRNNNIDIILKKAQKDITALTELTITEIKKFPEKPGVKKEFMIIYFCEKPEIMSGEKKKTTRAKKIAPIVDEVIEIVENTGETEKIIIDEQTEKLKKLVKEEIMKLSQEKKFALYAQLIPLSQAEDILEFIEKNGLEVNLTLI